MTTIHFRGTKVTRSASARPVMLHILAACAVAILILIPMAVGPTLLLGGAITLWALGSFAAEHPDG